METAAEQEEVAAGDWVRRGDAAATPGTWTEDANYVDDEEGDAKCVEEEDDEEASGSADAASGGTRSVLQPLPRTRFFPFLTTATSPLASVEVSKPTGSL